MELELYHKEIFYGQNAVHNVALIEQCKARCQMLYGKAGAGAKLKQTTSDLLKLIHPSYWNAKMKGNADVETEKQFAYLILSIEQHTKQDLDEITMLDFYHTTNFIKQVAKANKENNR